MKTMILCAVMIAFFALSASSIAEAMTAERVIENMIVSYEKQMKGVEDFTIVTDRDITYQKRVTIKGRAVYKTRIETEMMGIKSVSIYDGVYQWWVESGKLKTEKMDYSPFQMLENLKTAQVKYAGTDKIDGHKAHILNIKDYKMWGVEGMQKVSGKLWVDARDWVIRKMEVDMEVEGEKGEKIPATVTIRMEDFRKVNGMLIPYRTVMTVPVPGVPEISPEEEQEMRKNLAEMQRQLKQAPPEMRKMIEAMMKPQMEMMQKMLAAGGIEIVTVVKDVKVNTGLSDELFDGSKLR